MVHSKIIFLVSFMTAVGAAAASPKVVLMKNIDFAGEAVSFQCQDLVYAMVYWSEPRVNDEVLRASWISPKGVEEATTSTPVHPGERSSYTWFSPSKPEGAMSGTWKTVLYLDDKPIATKHFYVDCNKSER